MIKFGWLVTLYICFSFILFLAASFTIGGWIIYGAMLLPFYGIVLLGWWVFVWRNRTQTARIKYWLWGIVLGLQVATILASPGNCYGIKQGANCYSNLQILLGNVPRLGPSDVPHWQPVENAFLGFLAAYGAALVVALAKTKVVTNID